jgi:hypothetical protein
MEEFVTEAPKAIGFTLITVKNAKSSSIETLRPNSLKNPCHPDGWDFI